MAILIKDKNIEVFEVSDGDLKLIKASSEAGSGAESNQVAIDLYKMEYERAAQRYDDLYKAAWTNFSYLALVSGAILTFGSNRFMPELSVFFATLPLLFWWRASFEPLNRYGDQVIDRLKSIEEILSKLGGLRQVPEVSDDKKGLQHYGAFASRQIQPKIAGRFWFAIFIWLFLLTASLAGFGLIQKPAFWWSVFMILVLLLFWWMYEDHPRLGNREFGLSQLLRVRFIVRAFAGAILIVAICSAWAAYHRHKLWNEPYIRRSAVGETKQ